MNSNVEIAYMIRSRLDKRHLLSDYVMIGWTTDFEHVHLNWKDLSYYVKLIFEI